MIDRILLSRTDNIGDVLFTLPMAGLIKKYYPKSEVLFLGKKYTRPIIECSKFVDEFYDWDEIKGMDLAIKSRDDKAKSENFFKNLNIDAVIHVFPNQEIAKYTKIAGIPIRIGTNRRFYHWLYCNKKVNLSRKNSALHESQLNIKLLKPVGISTNVSLNDIPNYYGFSKVQKLNSEYEKYIDKNKTNVILHPKSKGSAKEWLPENFVKLSYLLPKEKFNFIACGVKDEELYIQTKILAHAPHIQNAVGQFDLSQYVSFIHACDALIAASTGPLHIAAALEKHAIGLYPPERPINPERWGPIGKKSVYFTGSGDYMEGIGPEIIATYLDQTWKLNT